MTEPALRHRRAGLQRLLSDHLSGKRLSIGMTFWLRDRVFDV